MKWQGRRQSSNVEDRRGIGSSKGGKAVIGGGLIGIVALLLTVFGGEQGQQIGQVLNSINQGQGSSQAATNQRELTEEEKEMGAFVSTVFADCEDVWTNIFRENNLDYQKPTMVLFTGEVSTGCGQASSSTGPFYCPADQKVYMDLDFFEELRTKFGAKGGDFAVAYVIAHEVGHHIQTVLGTSSNVRELQSTSSKIDGNKLSVCLELQADFYAGLFAHANKQYLELGDIDEALSAAEAVGDDAIQKRMRGYVEPESFTHGTSEQRKKWFNLGFETGDISYRDTFTPAGFSGVK